MNLMQKYSVNNYQIEIIISWYKSGEIAIPEIQRPFVWDSTKVRNLLDSLYNGYPIGYLIIWKNPNVRLKDGEISEGKKILIDGQQRVISLITSILAKEIVTKDYKKIRITISFNPQTEKFEVFNPAIKKDVSWINDIGPIIMGEIKVTKIIKEYCERNPSANFNKVEDSIENVKNIMNRNVGIIELVHDMDIEIVTEIFIRINSAGIQLNQADFAMSKIAANESYEGNILRKSIDYFCHLMRVPEFFDFISKEDKEFVKTDFFKKISWLKNENDDLYDPGYADMLRVAFTSEFNRGKLSDLVSLLSGRNFETRAYEESIARSSFDKLKHGILNFINETNFKRFLMIIKSAGFISHNLIRSRNVLNFAYILYLKLKSQNYNTGDDIEKYVRRWFVLSVLTGRYSGSPESKFDFDIRNISSRKFGEFLSDIENAELSDAYWDVALIQKLNTSVASSPYFNIFLAAQAKSNDKGFLSKDITIRDLITQRGDIHHIFPRDYLKSKGLKRGDYNQIANYVYTQSEINIKIGKKSPEEYMSDVFKQCEDRELKYGGITDMRMLLKNLKENCIPEDLKNMEVEQFENFLEKRRILMAEKIKEYYYSL
jgi:hypothetical protein